MLKTKKWLGRCGDQAPTWIELHQVAGLKVAEHLVPVWQITPEGGAYTGPIILYEDLPTEVRAAFERWQYGAAQPFHDAAFAHDFEAFLGVHQFPLATG